jgi:cold shock CspA family protein
MKGTINRIPEKEGRPSPFAFIHGEDNKEYFLHKSELFDSWDDLKARLRENQSVTVNFESTKGEKGPRAVGARIID